MSCLLRLEQTTTDVAGTDGSRAWTADQSMGGNKITSLGAPVAGDDAARKSDVDAVAAGLAWKDSVLVSDGGDLSGQTLSFGAPTLTISGLTAGASLGQLDGVEPVAGDRVLIRDAGNAGVGANDAYNGIWEITGGTTTSLTMTRVTDMDSAPEFESGAVFVDQGSTDADKAFVQTETVVTVNTDSVLWVQFGGVSGLSGATPTTINAGDAGTAGVASTAARGDHEHPVATGAASSLDTGSTSTEGSSTDLARADHTHAISSAGTLSTINAGDAASDGAETGFANKGHQHAVSTAAPTASVDAGDAAAEGSATSLARSDHQHAVSTGAAVSGAKANAEGTSTDLARADHTHIVPSLASADIGLTPAPAAPGADTTLDITDTPFGDGGVFVIWNGMICPPGDGVKTGQWFFTDDGGTTAKAIADIAAGDSLYVGTGGVATEGTDEISFLYSIL